MEKEDLIKSSFLPRTEVLERHDYKPTHPVEVFMVRLLKHHIQEIISTYGKPTSSNPRVLDVGCGRQPFRKDLEALGYTYISVDVQQNPEESVDIICEIDKPLPDSIFSLGTFDFIFCTEVMEHVADWNMAFSNFTQLLAPKGRLFITCPHFYILHEEPYDFWRPTPYALRYFGDRFGLKVLHEIKAGNAWDVIGTSIAISYTLPASPTLKNRILNKIISKCLSFLLQLLDKRHLQNAVNLHSPLYLSNIMVFEK